MLAVEGLNQSYGQFGLRDVTFSLETGYIMGFIGRNGAGKTTTRKTMMNLVAKQSGSVRMLGRDFAEQEQACKQEIGFMLGGADYYPKKRLGTIAKAVRRFYTNWDQEAYGRYLQRFGLDESKRVDELSQGMRVKFNLALALSHGARLLILDEPTSGLDPVSRDSLLELFQQLIEDGERSILFSTHITSDLEKCADFITYMRRGEVVLSKSREELLAQYRTARGPLAALEQPGANRLIGVKRNAFGFYALARTEDLPLAGVETAAPDIETIMVHMEQEDGYESADL